MPGLCKLTSEQQGRAIGLLAGGASLRKAASEIGVSRSALNRFANKADVRRRIEDQAARLLDAGLDEAVALHLLPMKLALALYARAEEAETASPGSGAQILKEGKTVLLLADKAASRILGAAGITPGQHGPVFAPVFVDARQQILSPAVLTALGGCERLARVLGGGQSETN